MLRPGGGSTLGGNPEVCEQDSINLSKLKTCITLRTEHYLVLFPELQNSHETDTMTCGGSLEKGLPFCPNTDLNQDRTLYNNSLAAMFDWQFV